MPLLTIVFTDVVESSATKRDVSLGRDDRERDRAYLEKIQTRHFSLIRECCQAHQGNEVGTAGDAFYLTFDDPVEAVRCAVDIQKRLAAEPIEAPRHPLWLRIGIHSGFPEPFEGGWHGADVDMAARVEQMATERQILLSSRTYELVRHMADVKFHPHGEFAMKGVDRTALWEADWDGKGPRRTKEPSLSAGRRKKQMWLAVGAAVLMLIAADAAYRSGIFSIRRPSHGPQQAGTENNARRSVAVLEFMNQGGPNEAWLGTALSEMLTTQLAAGGELRAIPGDDVARTTTDLSLAGMITFSQGVLGKVRTNLGSDYVVSGSYTFPGSPPERAIHVELQLDDTQSGATVSSSSYEGTVDGLSDLVKQIGWDVRKTLTVQGPTDEEVKQANAAAPSKPEALQRYAEGLAKLRAFDLLEARDQLQKAVALEPDYALAHAALANAWQLLGYDKNAEEEAKKAVDLSAGLSQADRRAIEARYREIAAEWDKAAKIYGSLWDFYNDEPKFALEEAHAQAEAGRATEALTTLDSLRKADSRAQDDPRIDYEEALAADKLGDAKREHAAASRAAEKAAKQDARLLEAQADWQDCGALLAIGNLKEAKAACLQADQLADLASGRQARARGLTVLASIMEKEGDRDRAMELRKEALGIAREIGSQKDIVGALLNLAQLQSAEGQIAESRANQQSAIELARKIADVQQILDWQNNYAVDLYTQGDYAGAKAMYEQELSTARNVGDQATTSDALQNLGVLLFHLGDLAGAQQDFQQALAIAEHAGLRSEQATALNNLGDIQMARGELAEAKKNYGEALGLSTRINDQSNVATSRLSLARVALEQGNAGEAENLARQASEAFQSQRLPDSEGDARSTLASALLAQNKLAQAGEQIDQALKAGPQDKVIQISIGVTSARLKAKAGKQSDAKQELETNLATATQLKLVGAQLELKMVEAEIEATAEPASAQARLKVVEDLAKTAGYASVAAKAARIRKSLSK